MLSSRRLGASYALMIMTGNFAPASFSACWTSVPDTSGICRSSTRQSGRSKCQDFKNSSPEGKPRAAKPAACSTRTTALRTAGQRFASGVYVELPANCKKLGDSHALFSNNAFIERWSVQCPGGLVGHTIAIAGLSATLTDVLVRIQRIDGTTQ